MRRHHDMGGQAAGPVDTAERDYAPWEKRVDAIVRLMSDKKLRLIRVDELRRGIEDLGPPPTKNTITMNAGSPRRQIS